MAQERKRFKNTQGGEIIDTHTGKSIAAINVAEYSIADSAALLATILDALEARYAPTTKGD